MYRIITFYVEDAYGSTSSCYDDEIGFPTIPVWEFICAPVSGGMSRGGKVDSKARHIVPLFQEVLRTRPEYELQWTVTASRIVMECPS